MSIDKLPLRAVDGPHKDEILEMLDEIRADVEAGRTVSLVAIQIESGTNRNFAVRVRGEIRTLELIGLLSRAWMDMVNHLKLET